jgi:hypothetical protein
MIILLSDKTGNADIRSIPSAVARSFSVLFEMPIGMAVLAGALELSILMDPALSIILCLIRHGLEVSKALAKREGGPCGDFPPGETMNNAVGNKEATAKTSRRKRQFGRIC